MSNEKDTNVEESNSIPNTSIVVMVLVLLIAFACAGVQVVLGMTATDDEPQQLQVSDQPITMVSSNEMVVSEDLPEGVAATVNGTEIPEEEITGFIVRYRTAQGLEDEEAWSEWLIAEDTSASDLRARTVGGYVTYVIIDQLADQLHVALSPEEREEALEAYIEKQGGVEAVEEQMAESGSSWDDIEKIAAERRQREIMKTLFIPDATDEDIDNAVLANIKANVPEYADVESLADVPEDAVDEWRARTQAYDSEFGFTIYLNKFVNESEIYISPIPDDADYNVNVEFAKLLNQLKAAFAGADDSGEEAEE